MLELNNDIKNKLEQINNLYIPDTFISKIKEWEPNYSTERMYMWILGFKRYLELQLIKPNGMSVMMPSVGADYVWHAALLHTRWYQKMCDDCLGFYLHHEPEPFLSGEDMLFEHWTKIYKTYELECKLERISPGTRVTYLFGLDANSDVTNGYLYGTPKEVELGYAKINIKDLLEYA